MKIKSTLLSIFYIVMALPQNDMKPSAFMVMFSLEIELVIILTLYVLFYRDKESFLLDRILTFIFGIVISGILFALAYAIGGAADNLGMKEFELDDWNPFETMRSGMIVSAVGLVVTYSISMYFVHKADKQALALQPHMFYQVIMIGALVPCGLLLILLFGYFGHHVVALSFIGARILLEYLLYKKMTAPTKENTEEYGS